MSKYINRCIWISNWKWNNPASVWKSTRWIANGQTINWMKIEIIIVNTRWLVCGALTWALGFFKFVLVRIYLDRCTQSEQVRAIITHTPHENTRPRCFFFCMESCLEFTIHLNPHTNTFKAKIILYIFNIYFELI